MGFKKPKYGISISRKIGLESKIRLKSHNGYCTLSVAEWIKLDSKLIYQHIHRYKSLNIKRVQLNSPAEKLFEKTLSKEHPLLYKSIVQKRARINVLRKLRQDGVVGCS